MPVETPQPQIKVRALLGKNCYRTEFSVGVQSFIITRVEGDPNGKAICRDEEARLKAALAEVQTGAPWSIKVEPVGKVAYQTVFTVGDQDFIIDYVYSHEEYAKVHCEFMKRMFVKALANIGVRPRRKRQTKNVPT